MSYKSIFVAPVLRRALTTALVVVALVLLVSAPASARVATPAVEAAPSPIWAFDSLGLDRVFGWVLGWGELVKEGSSMDPDGISIESNWTGEPSGTALPGGGAVSSSGTGG